MSFLSSSCVYSISDFLGKVKFLWGKFLLEKEDTEVGGSAACLDYPRTLVFYMPATLWYSFHRGRQRGEVFDAISYETGRNCYINFSGRGAGGPIAYIVRTNEVSPSDVFEPAEFASVFFFLFLCKKGERKKGSSECGPSMLKNNTAEARA